MPSEAGVSAVLWDLDGTLVDTEPAWLAAEERLVTAYGGTWSHEQALGLVGSGLLAAAVVLQGAGVRLPAPEIVDRLTDDVVRQVVADPPWRPGALDLLRAVRDAGLPTALVTMSVRPMAEALAAAVPFSAFDVVVSGSDVTHAKPHPEAYLTAAAALGVDPGRCAAIEDSPTGLAAAVAAGTRAVGVQNLVPLQQGDTWTLWPTLVGRTPADLDALPAPLVGTP